MGSRIIVTGANGFVGQYVCQDLLKRGHEVIACVRDLRSPAPPATRVIEIGDISEADWDSHLLGAQYIVHLAGRAHTFEREGEAKRRAFHQVNVVGTSRLAEAGVRHRIQRMVYVSSIKVNGESSSVGYRETDAPNPQDAYGYSKAEAESSLKKSGINHVVIRPPLVYGKGVRGNFARLVRLTRKGVPLPLGSVKNQRSLVYVENLADFIGHSLTHENAANETFIVSDGVAVSTPELLRMIADVIGKPVRLVPFTPALIRAFARMLGKGAEIEKLIGSMVVDSSKARERLNWTPPFSMKEGLKRTL